MSCGAPSLEDFREEGEGITRSLTQELRHIHTREELLAASPQLKIRFQELVSVMIAADNFRRENGMDYLELSKENHITSEALRTELNRLCKIEGGSDILEVCQEEALSRLEQRKKAVRSDPF